MTGPTPIAPDSGVSASADARIRVRRGLRDALIVALVWTAAAVALARPHPQPRVHDEFSYLLAADTLAHGRLANPPHPLARFFASPHVLQRPTYASKYPLGHALPMALSLRLTGDPFYGVLAECALMLFGFTVLLHLWTPPSAARVTAAVIALGLLPPMYWSYSYWGGAMAATGAAVVLTGVALGRAGYAAWAGSLLATGAVILFWTRPFEGGVFCLGVLLVFGREVWTATGRRLLAAAAIPCTLALLITAAHNQATTGRVYRLPYFEYDAAYGTAPLFWLLPMRRDEPPYPHRRLQEQHGHQGWEAVTYANHHPWPRGVRVGLEGAINGILALTALHADFVGLTLLILLGIAGRRDAVYRRMTFVVAGCVAGITFEGWHFEHYAAPAMAAFFVAIAAALGRVWQFRPRGMRVGPVMACCLMWLPLTGTIKSLPLLGTRTWADERALLLTRLGARARPQLVVVSYPPSAWPINDEWVYNPADIDGQRVILEHDLGPDENAALRAYYPERELWRLTVTDRARTLEHWP